MEAQDLFKPLSQIAQEFHRSPKTLYNHIKKNERLRNEIQSGLQPPKKQKLIYEELGYPPGVNKKDYENV